VILIVKEATASFFVLKFNWCRN